MQLCGILIIAVAGMFALVAEALFLWRKAVSRLHNDQAQDPDSRYLYRVKVELGFVDGSAQEIPLTVRAKSREELNTIVTRDYIMKNVSDDWRPPIRNVTIVKASRINAPNRTV